MSGATFNNSTCLTGVFAFRRVGAALFAVVVSSRLRLNANNEKPMSLQPVRSSAIRAMGYDGRTLTVEFHTGRVYDHPNVPYEVFEELMQAPSKGRYYTRNIRGKYR